jgi:hypothetical protein
MFQSFARELHARFEEELLGDWSDFPDEEEGPESEDVRVNLN